MFGHLKVGARSKAVKQGEGKEGRETCNSERKIKPVEPGLAYSKAQAKGLVLGGAASGDELYVSK